MTLADELGVGSPLNRFVVFVFSDSEGTELLARFDSIDGMMRWSHNNDDRKRVKLVRLHTLVDCRQPRGYHPLPPQTGQGMVQYDGVLMIITVQSVDDMMLAYDRVVSLR